MHLDSSLKPEDIDRPANMAEADHTEREHLRQYLSERFNRQRNASKVKGYNAAFARVKGLMRSDHLFNLDNEPQAVRDRYGKTEFGQHALLARRMIEAGVPMVKVARAWWDTHTENFESHRELVTELDHVMSTLITDLDERGLLEDTLIITLGEFGRTPGINKDLGRDHFASAWSCSLTGSGVRGGAVHGKTDEKGEKVVEGKVGPGDLIATIYKAAGIDPHKEYYHGLRPIPLAPEGAQVAETVIS